MKKLILASLAILFTTSSLFSAEWKPVGPPGGPVFDIDRSLSNPDVLMVVAEDGIYRSADRGRTWIRASGDLPRAEIIRIDPLDPETAYVSRFLGHGGARIYKTEDAGMHWLPLDGLPQSIRSSGILIDPRDPRVLHLGSDCYGWNPNQPAAGVFTSRDGGLTWARAEFTGQRSPCVVSLALDPKSPDHLYVTPGRRSLDGGKTWSEWTGPLPGGEIVTDRDFPSRRYGTEQPVGGLFLVSEDEGSTWQQFTPGGILPYPSPIATVIDSDPGSGRLFLGTELGLYRSGDGGRQWAPVEGRGREPVIDLSVDPRDGSVIAATKDGVHVSEGFPWSDWDELDIGNRTRRVQFLRHAPAPGGDLYASFHGSGLIYRSGDFGARWSPAGPLVPYMDDPVKRTRIKDFAVTRNGDLFVIAYQVTEYPLGNNDRHFLLRAGSAEWVSIDPPPAPTQPSVLLLGPLAVDPQSSTVYLGQSNRLVRSTDYGRSWDALPLPSGLGVGQILINPGDSSTLVLSTSKGVVLSVDGGFTWTLTGMIADPTVPIVQSSGDPRVLYLWGVPPDGDGSSDRRLYRSLDAGLTWEIRGTGPLGTDASALGRFTSMAVDPRDPLVVYVATLMDGVFRSVDGGVTWQTLGTDLPGPFENSPVSYPSRAVTLAVDPLGRFLFAAMPDRDIWRLSLTSRGRLARRP